MTPQVENVQCEHCLVGIRIKVNQLGLRAKCPSCQQVTALKKSIPGDLRADTVNALAAEMDTNADSKASWEQNASPSTRRSSGSVTKSSGILSDPKQLGRFQLQRKLGQGGFGEVWEARDIHLGRRVAIKLPIFPMGDLKRSRRFVTEAQASARLGHPNIVAVYDAGVIDAQHYLAIEFVDGQSLDLVQRDRPLTHLESAKLCIELATALMYAHEQSIVHRDIKPQNIVVDAELVPKIVDFGLAKLLEQDSGQTVDGTVMGTPAYMAPEQAKGEIQKIGPHTDQYSLGSILYWLITKQAPFVGPRIAVITQVISSEPQKPTSFDPKIDPQLEAICLKAMSKHPKDRYANCGEFADDLRRFCSGEDILARPIGRWRRTCRLIQRHPRESALAVVALTIFVLLFGISIAGVARSITHSYAADHASNLAKLELQKQIQLEKELEAKLVEVDSAKNLAIAAKENAELKNREAIAASEAFQALQATNESLNAKQGERQKEMTDAKVQAVQMKDRFEESQKQAIEAYEAKLNADPVARLKLVHQLEEDRKWGDAKSQLSLVPVANRSLVWKLLNYFATTEKMWLVFTPQAVRSKITSLHWNHSFQRNDLLGVQYRDGSFDLFDKLPTTSKTTPDDKKITFLETVPKDQSRFMDSEFSYDRASKILTGLAIQKRAGFNLTELANIAIEKEGILVNDPINKSILAIGLDRTQTAGNSVLRVDKLVGTTWVNVSKHEMDRRGLVCAGLASSSVSHVLQLRPSKGKNKTKPAMFAVVQGNLSANPSVSFVEDDSDLPLFAKRQLRSNESSDSGGPMLKMALLNDTGGVRAWGVSLNEPSSIFSTPIPIRGMKMSNKREAVVAPVVFDGADRIFIGSDDQLGVCILEARTQPQE